MTDVSRPAEDGDLQLESMSKPGKRIYFSLDGDRELYIGIEEGKAHLELYVSAESTQRLRDWLTKELS